MTVSRTRCITESFKLQRRNNIRALVIGIFIKLFKGDRVITSCYNDCTIFFCNDFFFLIKINGSNTAGFFTESADSVLSFFKGLHMKTILGVDICNLWNSLSKRNINCFTAVQAKVKAVRNLFVRTLFNTFTTTSTLCFINIARVSFNINFKVSDVSAYSANFRSRKNADIWILAYFSHLWSYNT